MKYIIKNCPNLTTSFYSAGEIIHNQCGCSDDDMRKDRNNCLLKQIVEKCDSNTSKVLYEGETIKFIEGNPLAKEILKLLEIEECEDE